MLAALAFVSGCATGGIGYRSHVEVTPQAGKNQYSIAVKVMKLEQNLMGEQEEIILYNVPSNTWDKGKPQEAEVTTADGATKVSIKTFVPKEGDDGTSYAVQVHEKGVLKMETTFKLNPAK